jgi:AcrR family transcriptional regulator
MPFGRASPYPHAKRQHWRGFPAVFASNSAPILEFAKRFHGHNKRLTKNERSFYYAHMNAARTSATASSQASKPSKGEETRAAILKAALRHASAEGFEALTIGVLAEKTGLSKSGLFAHFGSKEELQIATLDEAIRRFNEAAVLPALTAPRGLKRLTALFDHWLEWNSRAQLTGCPMMTAITEFDDKPGPMRDAVVEHMRRSQEGMIRSVQMAIDAGEFAADTDPEQFAFELFGIVATCYRARNLFHDPKAHTRAKLAFDRLVKSALADPASIPAPQPDR